MAEFFEKTWFVWWIFATLIILRWFSTISSSVEFGIELDGEGMEGSASPKPNLL